MKQFAIPVFALFLATSGPAPTRALAQGPPPGYGWDAPPQELNEIQRQGFHEGIEAARHDFELHRQPSVEDHEIFRHPHLPPEQRDVFRDGFRRGYDRATSHLMGAPQAGFVPPGPPLPGQWDAFPTEFNETQQHGFHDGIEGARHDYENHRPPDVNNREEFRHPRLPPELREAYRQGFRRGYDRAMAHLMGQPFRY
jgi:hypothetical protein